MGPTLIDGEFWKYEYSKSDYSKWLPKIEEKRKETDGNYDGAFGTVSNFSWTFQDDGTYDIKLEIINLGDVIESLKANLPSIIPDGLNPLLYAKFNSLLDRYGTEESVEENEFYGVLYPGLKASITDWFNRSINGENNANLPDLKQDKSRTVYIYGGNHILYGTKNGKSDNADWIKPDSKLGIGTRVDSIWKLSDSNEFYTSGTKTPYVNPNLTKLTEGIGEFEITQEDIRKAIQSALANWYYIRRWVKYRRDPKNNKINTAYASATLSQFRSEFDTLASRLKDSPFKLVKKRNDRWYEYNGYIPTPNNGEIEYYPYDLYVADQGSQSKVMFDSDSLYTPLGPEYFLKSFVKNAKNIKNKADYWNYVLLNEIPPDKDTKGEGFTFGPGIQYIIEYVYRYFKDKGKAKPYPLTEEEKELEENNDLTSEERSILEQTVEFKQKDLRNRNKRTKGQHL